MMKTHVDGGMEAIAVVERQSTIGRRLEPQRSKVPGLLLYIGSYLQITNEFSYAARDHFSVFLELSGRAQAFVGVPAISGRVLASTGSVIPVAPIYADALLVTCGATLHSSCCS